MFEAAKKAAGSAARHCSGLSEPLTISRERSLRLPLACGLLGPKLDPARPLQLAGATCRLFAARSSTCCYSSSSSCWTGGQRFASWRFAATPVGQSGRRGAPPRGGSQKISRLSCKARAFACRASSSATFSKRGPVGTSTRSGQTTSARPPF